MAQQKEDCFVVEGKLALPYQYFAGRTGSRFLIALRDEKKIMGLRCDQCHQVFVPPRSVCDTCFVDISQNWVELQNRGVVTGFTVVRYDEPHHPVKAPYILALIKLQGADSPFAHIVQGIDPAEMRIGLKVEAVFARETTATIRDIDYFRPVDQPAAAKTEGTTGRPAGGPGPGGLKLGYSYDELEIGMSASFSKTISESDVYLFAGITGDFNPVHVNEDFAKQTPFGTRIAHGGLPQCLIANVLGMQLPGLGTVALEVTTRFKKPTFFGDTITATAEVTEKLPQKRWVKMTLTWTNQKGEVVCQGSALVLPPPALPK